MHKSPCYGLWRGLYLIHSAVYAPLTHEVEIKASEYSGGDTLLLFKRHCSLLCKCDHERNVM